MLFQDITIFVGALWSVNLFMLSVAGNYKATAYRYKNYWPKSRINRLPCLILRGII
jgi:hypothetical protein